MIRKSLSIGDLVVPFGDTLHIGNRWSNGFLWGSHKDSWNFTAGIISTSKKGHFLTATGEEFV